MKLLCKDFHIIKTLKTDTKEIKVIPAKTEIRKKRILVHPARIELRKINCEIINPILISKIQKQLYALGFYSENFQGEFNNQTKTAIIKYQVKNNLSIGQLENETVKHILSQKTPFQD